MGISLARCDEMGWITARPRWRRGMETTVIGEPLAKRIARDVCALAGAGFVELDKIFFIFIFTFFF